jgi:hypothetical protein
MVQITTKFTTSSDNYDLMQDNGVRTKLLTMFTPKQLEKGLRLDITVVLDPEQETTINVNGRDFDDDFIAGTTWSTNGKADIKSLTIGDTNITGYITIK